MRNLAVSNRVIDVVILSWNRALMTTETISNVLAQEDVDLKVWVVDQGSDSMEVAKLHKAVAGDHRVTISELGQNLGVAKGRNYGMGLGTGELIIGTDNDAVFKDPRTLSKLRRRFERDANLGVIGFRTDNFYSGNLDIASWAYPRGLILKKDQEFTATRFPGAGHAIRRTALDQTTSYDERLFFYWEELDLSYQLIDLGYKILYCPEYVVLHKRSDEKRMNWAEGRFYYLVRNALYLEWKYFRSARRWLVLALGYLAKGYYNREVKQAGQGVWDALGMVRKINLRQIRPLSKSARAYIYDNDLIHRGGTLARISSEVLER